ncbi:hypothetical protein [uncultured Ilyobacter sp.]|uniref:hypothetical protein n=1 Tax=uncultured Ilyobacter sp. TaxID=544433 RepID=UPI0029F51E2A|nr:hypothetical protein [uncultured Ilyobacter sp.]
MKDIVKILETNKHSINIKNDYLNRKKIDEYYPTYKNMRLLDKFLRGIEKKQEGSVILSGAYGTGKSYLVSVLLSILDKDFSKKGCESLLNKARSKYDIEETISNFEGKKYFIVFADDGVKEFSKSILLGLYQKSKDEGLDINLSISYRIIQAKIDNWEKNHPSTYEKMINILKNRKIEGNFFQRLDEMDDKALKEFSSIYKELFSGEEFTPLEKPQKIEDVLEEAEKQIKNAGYEGIIYVFDEFGRYLERGIDNIDVKEVQDMAEYCNQENSSNIILVTHKDMFQYTKRLMVQENRDEWEKVSGRFLREHLTYEKINVMEILANILNKKKYGEYRVKNKEEFHRKEKLLKNSGLNIENEKTEVEKYYPLDYTAALLLPGLAQKLAQNERTLFSFVCGDEEKGLKNLIENSDEIFIGLDKLYDYFEENFRFLSQESDEYKVYLNSKNLLSKLKSKENHEIKFIKSLAVIYIYNNFSELEPSPEIMKNIMNLEDTEKIDKVLRERNLVNYRKHYKHYKLVEDIDINVDREIEEYVDKKLNNFDYTEILEKNLKMQPYYPLKYNDIYNITRYVGRYYIDASRVSRIEEIEKEVYEDGKIIYLTNIENNQNYMEILELLVNKDLIVISNRNGDVLNIGEQLKELEAIERLLLSERYQKEGVLKSEISACKSEILHKIQNEINRYFENGVINQSKDYNKKNLLEYSFDYLEKKYSEYFPINYELINKNNLSVPMKKARYEILSKLYKNEPIDDDKYFGGTNAESTVARILLKNSGLYKNGEMNIDGSVYSNLYEEIMKDIKSNKTEMEKLYEIYCSNKGKYGVRRGIFTFLMGIIFVKNYQYISIIHKGTNSEIELDMKILEELEKNPKNYQMSYYFMGEKEKEYIEELAEMFSLYLPKNRDKTANRVLAGIKNYVISMPRYVSGIFMKEHKKLNKLFSGIFSLNNAREFLLRDLPKIYIKTELTEVIAALENDLQNIEKYRSIFTEELCQFIGDTLGTGATRLHDSIEAIKKRDKINALEGYILGLEGYAENEILLKITEKIKGFSYENWRSEKDIEEFKENFKNEMSKNLVAGKKSSEEIISITYGKNEFLVDMSVEESMLGKMLRSKLESAMKNMAMSISEEEKRKILLEVFLKE